MAVRVMTRDEAEHRYQTLRDAIVDLEAFRRRGAAFELDAHDAAVYDELVDLEFLLDRR